MVLIVGSRRGSSASLLPTSEYCSVFTKGFAPVPALPWWGGGDANCSKGFTVGLVPSVFPLATLQGSVADHVGTGGRRNRGDGS